MPGENPTRFPWLLTKGSEGHTHHNPPRAQRFDLQLLIRYRAIGETTWPDGRTENISHTGVLFNASDAMQMGTQVEMSLAMPFQGSIETGAEVACHGEIVRTAPPASTDAQPCLAARILPYRFVQGKHKLGD